VVLRRALGLCATLVPFVVVIVALQALTGKYGVKLSISYFLGIAIGPLVADLFSVISPAARARMKRDAVRTFSLAPDVKGWSGYFPNPFKVLDRGQVKWTLARPWSPAPPSCSARSR
jgi:putative tricarboxylic transport membrane protein